MTTAIPPIVIAFKTATLCLGGLVTYLAARAARRTNDRALWALATGFGVVTLGALLAGLADQLPVADARTALVVESALTTAGFAVVAYSLRLTRPEN